MAATRLVDFGCRNRFEDDPYWMQSTRGVVALLRLLPEADMYWEMLDGRYPLLIRRKGRLVLAAERTTGGRFWDPDRQPRYLDLVDMPYTFEPIDWYRSMVKPSGDGPAA